MEELEARMRKGDATVLNRNKDDDMSAFKRLVSIEIVFVFVHCAGRVVSIDDVEFALKDFFALFRNFFLNIFDSPRVL